MKKRLQLLTQKINAVKLILKSDRFFVLGCKERKSLTCHTDLLPSDIQQVASYFAAAAAQSEQQKADPVQEFNEVLNGIL